MAGNSRHLASGAVQAPPSVGNICDLKWATPSAARSAKIADLLSHLEITLGGKPVPGKNSHTRTAAADRQPRAPQKAPKARSAPSAPGKKRARPQSQRQKRAPGPLSISTATQPTAPYAATSITGVPMHVQLQRMLESPTHASPRASVEWRSPADANHTASYGMPVSEPHPTRPASCGSVPEQPGHYNSLSSGPGPSGAEGGSTVTFDEAGLGTGADGGAARGSAKEVDAVANSTAADRALIMDLYKQAAAAQQRLAQGRGATSAASRSDSPAAAQRTGSHSGVADMDEQWTELLSLLNSVPPQDTCPLSSAGRQGTEAATPHCV